MTFIYTFGYLTLSPGGIKTAKTGMRHFSDFYCAFIQANQIMAIANLMLNIAENSNEQAQNQYICGQPLI
ncbi:MULTISPECIES: hypothetical protein [Raoultella]|uniref:hypothetical protein n=1 Tax=Raoultella TaxID=160674 RepID=UPI0021679226|nr:MULTISPECIES: hypothetical protein [Raoultella]MCS4270621.1 hypothetical protein [Raoultella sp. BIGb0132]MCS4287581.1 hypothetical protein [Raoultella terrigena]